jgi:hypothetical protein
MTICIAKETVGAAGSSGHTATCAFAPARTRACAPRLLLRAAGSRKRALQGRSNRPLRSRTSVARLLLAGDAAIAQCYGGA